MQRAIIRARAVSRRRTRFAASSRPSTHFVRRGYATGVPPPDDDVPREEIFANWQAEFTSQRPPYARFQEASIPDAREQRALNALHDMSKKTGWLKDISLPTPWLRALETGSTRHMSPTEREEFLNAMSGPGGQTYSHDEVPDIPAVYARALQTGDYSQLNSKDRQGLKKLINDIVLLDATLRDMDTTTEVPPEIRTALRLVRDAAEHKRLPYFLFSKGDGPVEDILRRLRQGSRAGKSKPTLSEDDLEVALDHIQEQEAMREATSAVNAQEDMMNHSLAHRKQYSALCGLRDAIIDSEDFGDIDSDEPRLWRKKFQELDRVHRDEDADELRTVRVGMGRRRSTQKSKEEDEEDDGDDELSLWEEPEMYRLERAYAASRGTPHLEDWPQRWQAALWADGELQADILTEIVGVERALLFEAIEERIPMLEENAREQAMELEERLAPTPHSESPQIHLISDMHRLQQIDRATREKPRWMSKPEKHEQTYGVPVAVIHFRSHELPLLELFVFFVQHAISALGIPSSGVAMLPSQRRLWTVLKSPFVDKKAAQNFERITHKRAIKLWDATARVVNFLEQYIAKHEMGGVGVRVVRWERAPLSVGETVYFNAQKHPTSHREMLENASKRVLKAEEKAAKKLRLAQRAALAERYERRKAEGLMMEKLAEMQSKAAQHEEEDAADASAAGFPASSALADTIASEDPDTQPSDDVEADPESNNVASITEDEGDVEYDDGDDDGDELDYSSDSDVEFSDDELLEVDEDSELEDSELEDSEGQVDDSDGEEYDSEQENEYSEEEEYDEEEYDEEEEYESDGEGEEYESDQDLPEAELSDAKAAQQ